MENFSFDVIIVGAGAAGLMAALEVALTGRTVAVVEAKDRTGGRMLTVVENGLAIELGPEFVHGNLPLTKGLLEKAAAKIYKVEGSIWQYNAGKLDEQEDFIEDYSDLEEKCKNLRGDKAVSQFFDEDLQGEKYAELRLGLKQYVEGYYAADTARASTQALCEELSKEDEEQYRIEGGYKLLVAYLEQGCREKGVRFFLSETVSGVQWKKGDVTVTTNVGTYNSSKLLITVSLGVLQNNGISFSPVLPEKDKAIRQLGFGHVVKLVMQFEEAFWKNKSLTDQKDLSDLNFLFSKEEIPTWWTHHPKKDAVLVGWLGGPKAEALQSLKEEEVTSKAIFSLSKIFNLDVIHLHQKLQKAHWYNWSADPHFGGAYSYAVVGGNEAISQLQQPVEQTIFFAGEALHPGPEIGTVEGALQNGRETAHRLVAAFSL